MPTSDERLSDEELHRLVSCLAAIDEAGIDEVARCDAFAAYRTELVRIRGGGSARVVAPLVAELQQRRAADLSAADVELLQWMWSHADANSVDAERVADARTLLDRLIRGRS